MAGKKKKQKEKIDMTFLCMTAARNKMVPHTSLPPFNNADGHLCQERLLRFRNFATMVTWCHTCPPYYLDVSKLLPCGHPATTDTPIIRTATKTQAKINYCWNLTEPPPAIVDLGSITSRCSEKWAPLHGGSKTGPGRRWKSGPLWTLTNKDTDSRSRQCPL